MGEWGRRKSGLSEDGKLFLAVGNFFLLGRPPFRLIQPSTNTASAKRPGGRPGLPDCQAGFEGGKSTLPPKNLCRLGNLHDFAASILPPGFNIQPILYRHTPLYRLSKIYRLYIYYATSFCHLFMPPLKLQVSLKTICTEILQPACGIALQARKDKIAGLHWNP